MEYYIIWLRAPAVVDGQATSGTVSARRHDVVATGDRIEPLTQRRWPVRASMTGTDRGLTIVVVVVFVVVLVG